MPKFSLALTNTQPRIRGRWPSCLARAQDQNSNCRIHAGDSLMREAVRLAPDEEADAYGSLVARATKEEVEVAPKPVLLETEGG